MGYDQVATGEVVEAATMNLALSQGVIRVGNTSERDALPAVEGMLCWQADVNLLLVFMNGWRPLGTYRQGYGLFAAQPIIDGGWMKLLLQPPFAAPGNMPGRAVWTADGHCRVPFSGTYLVTGHLAWLANPNGNRKLRMVTSSDPLSTGDRTGVLGGHFETNTPGNSIVEGSINGSVYLSANQYISIQVSQSTGAVMNLPEGYGGFAVILLGSD
jgi:hypothetical protein